MKKIYTYSYGVATMSRLLKSIGLFCKRALEKRLYSAEETCNFEEPTKRCHPICIPLCIPLIPTPICTPMYTAIHTPIPTRDPRCICRLKKT